MTANHAWREIKPADLTGSVLHAMPAFWELEDLLAAGLPRDAALSVMASRRSRPVAILRADRILPPQRRLWSRARVRLGRR